MKKKHIVVTRLGIKWESQLIKVGLSWDEWIKNSVYLMDKYCRPSLKNQKTQDFILLSLVDESVEFFGNTLDNEVILKIKSKNNYPREEIVIEINKFLFNFDIDGVITQRLDRDDCLKNDYLLKIKKYLENVKNEKYIDLNSSLTYDTVSDTFYDSKKYYNKFVSPFVATYEKIKKNGFECLSLVVDHAKIPKYLKGKKMDDLSAIQVIHGNNISNKVFGEEIKINRDEYGL